MKNSMMPFDGGSMFPSPNLGNSLISSGINSILALLYAKKWIEAQKKCAEVMMAMKMEERKAVIDALTKIALDTKDAQTRRHMFDAILDYAVS